MGERPTQSWTDQEICAEIERRVAQMQIDQNFLDELKQESALRGLGTSGRSQAFWDEQRGRNR